MKTVIILSLLSYTIKTRTPIRCWTFTQEFDCTSAGACQWYPSFQECRSISSPNIDILFGIDTEYTPGIYWSRGMANTGELLVESLTTTFPVAKQQEPDRQRILSIIIDGLPCMPSNLGGCPFRVCYESFNNVVDMNDIRTIVVGVGDWAEYDWCHWTDYVPGYARYASCLCQKQEDFLVESFNHIENFDYAIEPTTKHMFDSTMDPTTKPTIVLQNIKSREESEDLVNGNHTTATIQTNEHSNGLETEVVDGTDLLLENLFTDTLHENDDENVNKLKW